MKLMTLTTGCSRVNCICAVFLVVLLSIFFIVNVLLHVLREVRIGTYFPILTVGIGPSGVISLCEYHVCNVFYFRIPT